ncbi:MAG: hypothetical protein FJ100_20930 [Deltaproteobacteria bacterium]|nr:hypothetical protein [Deltaproteobacteria bacterium]
MSRDPEVVHRKALRAAAAVAFGVSACGDPATTVQGAPAATGDAKAETSVAAATAAPDAQAQEAVAADASVADGASARAAPDAADAPDAPVEAGQSKDMLAGADIDAGTTETTGKPDCTKAQQAGNWAACCESLRQWCEAAFGAGSQASNECTFGQNFDGSTGCTPWGPPAPPPWPGTVA